MTNDLISSEALKEQTKNVFCKRRCPMREDENYCNPNCAARLFIGIIDNAPTVSYPFDMFRTMLCGTCQAHMRIESERPQGEWEEPFEMNGKTYHKCTNCHISSELILIDKYCPECGAKMKSCDKMR